MARSREYTCKLLEFAEEGVLSWEGLARQALVWMSEYDVEDMAHQCYHELLEYENDSEDEEDEEREYA